MNRAEADELLNSLFEEWYSSLVRYAMRAGGSLAVAEDAVQEAFMSLYRELLQGREIGNPKGWTLCVVRREIVRRYREETRHGGPFQPLSEMADAAGPRAEERLPEWQDDDVIRLFRVLSRREEEVLLLRLKALKYRQIAVELGIGSNSVKTLLARALRKMQRASSRSPLGQQAQTRDEDDEKDIAQTLQ